MTVRVRVVATVDVSKDTAGSRGAYRAALRATGQQRPDYLRMKLLGLPWPDRAVSRAGRPGSPCPRLMRRFQQNRRTR